MPGSTTEIIRSGVPFLVQTQDNGPLARTVETLVYRRGRLVYSRKASWHAFLGMPDLAARIARLIEDQHREVGGDLAAGRLDARLFMD